MNYKSKLLILGLVSKIFAAKFSVVSFQGACQLEVNGKQYEMKQNDLQIPLYTVEVNVPEETSYVLIIEIYYI